MIPRKLLTLRLFKCEGHIKVEVIELHILYKVKKLKSDEKILIAIICRFAH